jgi:DNA-binding NtrC family response regulator
LNVIPVLLLPLRKRPEDILPLARHFLARHAAEAGRQLAFGAEIEQALLTHPWQGNVRELENAIERGVVLARGNEVTPEDLLLSESTGAVRPPSADGTLQNVLDGTLQSALDSATADRIRATLDAAHGQRAEAARALGIDRTTLYRLMKRLGIQG